MHEEQGRVVEQRGPRALVRIPGGGPCAQCAAAGSCRLDGGEGFRSVEALNPRGPRPGQKVAILAPAGAGLRASLARYVPPAAGLPAGAALAQVAAAQLLAPETGGRAAGVGVTAGALLGVLAARALRARLSRSGSSLPTITRILEDAPGS